MIVSLVTGASSGLGQEIAKQLCKKGHKVYVTARRAKLLELLKKGCRDSEGEIVPIPGDLTNPKFREKLIKTILQREKNFDYLINNAGFGKFERIEDQPLAQIESMYALNAIAYTHLIQLALPSMKKKKKGKIINISSVVAFTPLPYFATYDATKGAVTNLTRALSFELDGTGVHISAIHPARMKTGFANRAFECPKRNAKEYRRCVQKFNKIAGEAEKVAKYVARKLDSKRLILFPTFRARMLYTTRHFSGLVDWVTKKFMVPSAKEDLPKIKPK